MSRKYDIETYIAETLAMVQANLPAKIIEINAEKSDGTEIKQVPDADYFNSTSAQIFNSDPFIYYGLTDIEAEPAGSKTIITITMNFEVVFNNSNSGNTLEKVLRYSRSLREVFQENFMGSSKHSGYKVTELPPANAPLNQGSDFKIGGVSIVSTIAG